MRILAVGGGSGGHVTPVLAVIQEIKSNQPKAEIRFWCDRKFYNNAKNIFENAGIDIPIDVIMAGKLRRYHHLSFLQHITWPSLIIKNLFDSFLVLFGFIQSVFKLLIWRPDVVFTKGGYVCLPVGFAARLLNIPIVIHDSDAYPGLTNRILSSWAKFIATGAPLKYYPYDRNKAKYIGIPISKDFYNFSNKDLDTAFDKWKISRDYPIVLVTGGGLGASRINDAVIAVADKLLEFCSIVLISGDAQYEQLSRIIPKNKKRFQLHAFISKDIASLMGIADIVVARAGATTALELAAMKKPTIFIPNAKLTGGHQVKNANVYADNKAAIIIDEDNLVKDPDILVEAINNLLTNRDLMKSMSKKFAQFAKPNAASEMAEIIIRQLKKPKG
ncbi:MAG: UDP-N-acetylglucosamine--N-acetylmuramyl-(pentapeptide) pyrophosphoryl-undecaprenol N-acetylglucosamine transferase [Candidatus Saccharimonadales bacterium]